MIRIGILGWGNLGRGVAAAVGQAKDMTLAAIFTRRSPDGVEGSRGIAGATPVVSAADMAAWADKIDVLVLCGGSATDLPVQGPQAAVHFCTVDSFDTHAHIPEHYAAMDEALTAAGHVGVISVGWDPGLFSVQRATMQAVLPAGKTYTFWGRGVSQGHSDAIRRVPGVRRGVQYTVPIQAAMDAVRAGENPAFTARDMHERVCYVVPEAGADTARIEHDIVTMPNYFADYNTTVHFISEQEFEAKHTAMPHGGFVLRSGTTGLREAGDRVAGDGNKHLTEFSLTLQSNPAFTGSVLTAYARAVARLKDKGETGCRTALDIPAALLAEQDGETLRRELL